MISLFRSANPATAALLQQIGQLQHSGVKTVITQVPDLNGLLRCKMVPLAGLEDGGVINPSLYLVPHGDGQPAGEIVYESPYVWFHTGFGNILCLADEPTLVSTGWRPTQAEVLLNCYERTGERYGLDVRAPLQRLEMRLAERDWQMKVGVEFEFGLFHFDRELIEAGQYSKLKPYGHRSEHGSAHPEPDFMDLMEAFYQRMASVGISIASLHAEIGFAMYEIALAPETPLRAADNAMRLRHHLKAFCREHGLIATLMARYRTSDHHSANGTHVHVSLYDEQGHNLFYAPDALVSEAGQQFAAGVLDQMCASHLAFRPTLNSYRRLSRAAGNPEEVCWGDEHRATALRVVSGPNGQSCRFEHRCCGADVNLYMVVPLIAAAGLDGLDRKLEAPPLLEGDPAKAEGLKPLPRSMEASLEAFKDNAFVADTLGDALADQYARSRENELKAFQAWLEQDITQFEFQRYFEGV